VIAYIDSSVILRIVLNQPLQLAEWRTIVTGVTSSLAEVECLRTIDRLSVMGRQSPADAAARREAAHRIIEAVEVIALAPSVLRRAAQPSPVPLGTLDALHLASAESWRDANGKELAFATHDRELAQAARATGFRILGS
jgi:predicted nucleic acid-binding protein